MTVLSSPHTAASATSGSLQPTSLHIQAINSSSPLPVSSTTNNNIKRKRRPAGTPDPDAEVVALSPKTLMESDRYVCEICNQGFQRDQNLQMHRRRHNIPWKLLKKPTPVVRKRVYVCPDPTCLHNDPSHALGDLVGIKKHFRRKHSIEKQWKCDKCSKEYAVQSDYKAHLKTCGSRGHSCDCGRVFSRVESFIEHQGNCIAAKRRSTFAYGDPSSLPLLVATRSFNDTVIASMPLLSSAGNPFNSDKFNEQSGRNMEQGELDFFAAKDQTDTSSEAALLGVKNAADALLVKSPPTKRRWNISTSTTDEDKPESASWLQLSIGLRTHHEKKPQITPEDRRTALTLSPRKDSSSVEHNEAARLRSDTASAGAVSRKWFQRSFPWN